MNLSSIRVRASLVSAFALAISLVLPAVKATANTPFEQSVYLYNQAYDLDMNGPAGQGTGNWGKYKSWLGVSSLGAEADPGWGPGDWYDCCQHVNWNTPWAAMQQRYGSNLPTAILGMGQMPSDPNGNDTWNQKLAWEDQQWKLEAANDPTIMGYFANYAKEVNSLGFKKVIIRLGYEFDGGWNPFGNLNVMSNMPNNYIASWKNIINTMRANDPGHIIKFCWNPTDGNVQIWAPNFYPGDAYVDYVGIDTYDYAYNNLYPISTSQPTQAQRDNAWNNAELPRINVFANLARSHGKPMVIGEWGLWQLNDGSHPSGGDNTSYIQRMHDWMSDPINNVAAECYFEAPADGNSSLSGIFGTTTFPNSAALYKQIFSDNAAPIGHRIGIHTNVTNKYVSVNLYTGNPAYNYLQAGSATSISGWELFDVVDAGNGNIGLKSEATGKFVSVDMNQSSKVLRADWANTVDTWETFKWFNQPGGGFALKAGINNLFVSCDQNNTGLLEAQWASTVGSWEQFTWVDEGKF